MKKRYVSERVTQRPAKTQVPLTVPRVARVVDRSDVTVENSSDAAFAYDEDGREWIRKREVNTGCQPLLAEALGWLLSKALAVPVPDAAVCLVPEDRSWLSRRIPDAIHWSPESYCFIDNPDGLGAMIALDVILYNEDRHAGNILLQPSPDEYHLKAWAIDMGNALAGYPSEFAELAGRVPDKRNLARGLPLEVLANPALAFAHQARSLEIRCLRQFVEEACTIAREPDAERLLAALQGRCAIAPSLVSRYVIM